MASAQKTKITVVALDDYPFAKGRTRELGFLQKPGEKFVNALEEFSKLVPAAESGLNTAFEFFLQGAPRPKRHHGWDATAHGGRHVNCYVFKHGDGTRIYGFLLHPSSSPRAQLCCLVHLTEKHQDKTEQTILDDLERLFADAEVKKAADEYWKTETALMEREEK